MKREYGVVPCAKRGGCSPGPDVHLAYSEYEYGQTRDEEEQGANAAWSQGKP